MERVESTEDLDDRTKMDICLQEVSLIILFSCTIFMPQETGDLIEYGEVESGSTMQECKFKGFLANRKILDDASYLFCSNKGNLRSLGSYGSYGGFGFMIAGGFQGQLEQSRHSSRQGTPYQGYYQGPRWQSRHFGVNPKLPLKRRKHIGIFNAGSLGSF